VVGWILFSPTGSRAPEKDPSQVVVDEPQTDTEIIPPKTIPKAVAVTPSTEWTTYHGGPSLQGVAAATIPDRPTPLWRFQADSAIYQTPVATGGRIFFTTRKGGVYAIDMDGKEIWSKHIVQEIGRNGKPRMERFDAPIACFEDTVLVGSLNGTIFAFDTATGDEKWTLNIDAPILGTVNFYPSPEGSRVYVINQEEGNLHAIDLATGIELWKSDSIERCDGSPSVGSDVVVYGSCASALHVFSAIDGTLKFNIEFDEDSQVAGGAALVGDSAFVGTHSGLFFHVDIKTGEIIWINEDSEDEIFTTPAVSGDLVIFGSLDGSFYAIDRGAGELRWKFETSGIPVSPVIAGDKVLAGSDGTLYILQISTGKAVWSYEISDEITSPAVINNTIIVGSDDGTVAAYGSVGG